ncbi:unnamed protein product [Paramecium pentaurelia]|uniref:Uncharacterized protein n=1 Tax=Paramecium pentaurelia TaxID=43138 RepID=A0A8S1XMU9_9CILI|nr:unnamed protein product [Paramecium pentaurelia]
MFYSCYKNWKKSGFDSTVGIHLSVAEELVEMKKIK